MMRQDHTDTVRSILSELAQSQMKSALCLSQLQDYFTTDTDLHRAAGDVPHADGNTFCVLWRNRSCHLGHTQSFFLFAKMVHRCNHFISYDHLLRDVWRGESRSYDTVRSAVRELKDKLRHGKMHGLARAIRGQGRHYGLILGRL
jgi:hypothetical protein